MAHLNNWIFFLGSGNTVSVANSLREAKSFCRLPHIGPVSTSRAITTERPLPHSTMTAMRSYAAA